MIPCYAGGDTERVCHHGVPHHGGHALKGMHDAPYHMGWVSHPVGYATLCSLLSAPGIGAWDADGMP